MKNIFRTRGPTYGLNAVGFQKPLFNDYLCSKSLPIFAVERDERICTRGLAVLPWLILAKCFPLIFSGYLTVLSKSLLLRSHYNLFV